MSIFDALRWLIPVQSGYLSGVLSGGSLLRFGNNVGFSGDIIQDRLDPVHGSYVSASVQSLLANSLVLCILLRNFALTRTRWAKAARDSRKLIAFSAGGSTPYVDISLLPSVSNDRHRW